MPLADCIGFAIIIQSSGRGSECLFCGFGEGYAAILLVFLYIWCSIDVARAPLSSVSRLMHLFSDTQRSFLGVPPMVLCES